MGEREQVVEVGEGMEAHFHRAAWWASPRKGHVSKDSKEGGSHAEN